MFELVHTTVGSLAIANVYGLSNISISYFDMILAYLVAIVVSIIVALILRVPLLPSKPYRYSFDVSAVYLISDNYQRFELIERRYQGKELSDVESLKAGQNRYVKSFVHEQLHLQL